MSIALNKRQLLVIVLVLLSLLVATFILVHGAAPNLWHQLLTAVPNVIIHYG
jgi:uncharacterized membrane-anchored protein YjiN (DUF445 family)